MGKVLTATTMLEIVPVTNGLVYFVSKLTYETGGYGKLNEQKAVGRFRPLLAWPLAKGS